MNKNNYVIHCRNLQQCLELGMKLKKIHRILKFNQRDWIRPYIDFNTQKRMISNNEADKNFFNLMNNSVYGKTMENSRKRIKIQVVKNSQDFIKYTCVNWKVFDKPIYVGFTVLETSKWEMSNFHYNFMIRKFNTRLLFTDTELHEKIHAKECTSTKNYLI